MSNVKPITTIYIDLSHIDYGQSTITLYHIEYYDKRWQESIMAKLLLQLQTADVRMQCQMALVSEPACPTSEVLSSVHPGSNPTVGCVLLVGNFATLNSHPLPLVHQTNFSPICELRKDLTMIDYDWPWLPDDTGLKTASFVSNGCRKLRLVAVASWVRLVSEWSTGYPNGEGMKIYHWYIVCIYICMYRC